MLPFEKVEVRNVAGRYRIDGRLGGGGTADVYRATDSVTGRALALKRARYTSDLEEWNRTQLLFRREFHALMNLRHPGIVEVYNFGADDDGPYYTMELLPGADLRDSAPFSIDRASTLLRDVASALAFLHSRRLVHRDVSARNVRSAADGRAKLIDFGLLASVGMVPSVLAGTPPYIAPEVLKEHPLDARADLFSLGALGYWVVTGAHAYPAKTIRDLRDAWRRPLRHPSEVDPKIPRRLGDIIVWMLRLDPMARPRSAVEVMERLEVGASVRPLPESHNVRACVVNAPLVGRERELFDLAQALEACRRGRGSVTVICGAPGSGKTRLLREVRLEAELSGAEVLHIQGQDVDRGPYAALRGLGIGAVGGEPGTPSAPDGAAGHIGRTASAPSRFDDPREARARIQDALAQRLREAATRAPTVVLVDDLQRVDEPSAAVIAAFAHQATTCGALVVATVREDQMPRAPAALRTINAAAKQLTLGSLTPADVEHFVAAVFGQSPQRAKIAELITNAGGSTPLLCVQWVYEAFAAGWIDYCDGAWSIRPDLGTAAALPGALAEAMQRRIAALSPNARAVGELLAIWGDAITLEACVRLARPRSDEEIFGALDELVSTEVLVGSAHRYAFRHNAARETLLRMVTRADKRRLHARVASHLLAQGKVRDEQVAEVGTHLLHSGDELRAAPLLARAGERHFEMQSFREAIAPLEAALRINERLGADPSACFRLRHMLMLAGCLADRPTAIRYSEETLGVLRSEAGVDLAERASRRTGRHVGLALGVAAATARWVVRGRGRGALPPWSALFELIGAATYATAVHSLSWDPASVRRVVSVVRPLTLSRTSPLYALERQIELLLALCLGRLRTMRDHAVAVVALASKLRKRYLASEAVHTEASARWAMMYADAFNMQPSYDAHCDALADLRLRHYDVGIDLARVMYHRMRGEEDKARGLEGRVATRAVQLGTHWMAESQLQVGSALAYSAIGDVMGLKRVRRGLERLMEIGVSVELAVRLVDGEYHRLHGSLEAGRAQLQAAAASLPRDDATFRPAVWCGLAEIHLRQGNAERARTQAQAALSVASHPQVGQVAAQVRAIRLLALAEAALGRTGVAAGRIDRALERFSAIRSPSVSGGLHEAGARVAIAAGSWNVATQHVGRATAFYELTRNPVLIARARAVEDAVRFDGVAAAAASAAQHADTAVIGPESRPALHRGRIPDVEATTSTLK